MRRLVTEILGQMFTIAITLTVGIVAYIIVSSIVSSYLSAHGEITVLQGYINVNPANRTIFSVELVISTSTAIANITNVTVWHGDTLVNSTCLDCSSLMQIRSRHDVLQLTILASSTREVRRGDTFRVEITVRIGGETRKLSTVIQYFDN